MNKKFSIYILISPFILLQTKLFASTTDALPWETPFQKIVDSLSGPVVQIAAIASIAILGLTWAFGEGGGMFRKVIMVVAGLSIAAGAAGLVTSLFGITSGFILP